MCGLKFVCVWGGGSGSGWAGSRTQSFLQARHEVLVEVLKRGIIEFSGGKMDVNFCLSRFWFTSVCHTVHSRPNHYFVSVWECLGLVPTHTPTSSL